MSRIEQEARNLLLERREHLCRHLVEPPARADSEPARRELTEIENALRRIEDGSYGFCQACNGPMGMQRIRAIPEARYCVSCSGNRAAAD